VERAVLREIRPDLANEFVEVTEKKEEGAEMGFVRAAKMEDVRPGTIREVHVEGKAIALANVGGNSMRLITLAYIAEDRWRMVRWRGTW